MKGTSVLTREDLDYHLDIQFNAKTFEEVLVNIYKPRDLM